MIFRGSNILQAGHLTSGEIESDPTSSEADSQWPLVSSPYPDIKQGPCNMTLYISSRNKPFVEVYGVAARSGT